MIAITANTLNIDDDCEKNNNNNKGNNDSNKNKLSIRNILIAN